MIKFNCFLVVLAIHTNLVIASSHKQPKKTNMSDLKKETISDTKSQQILKLQEFTKKSNQSIDTSADIINYLQQLADQGQLKSIKYSGDNSDDDYCDISSDDGIDVVEECLRKESKMIKETHHVLEQGKTDIATLFSQARQNFTDILRKK